MPLNKLIEAALNTLKEAAEHDTWIVGFSGGKDSSVLVDLILRFVEKEGRPNRVYIIYSDTLLEPPPLRGYAISVIKAVNDILKGVTGIVVSPLDTNTDIVEMVIVRGYPAPSARFRWCTDRWKLLPSKQFISKLKLQNPAVITGVRAEEAAHRAGRAKGRDLREAIGGKAYMPLLEWSAKDVWAYIESYNPYWQLPDWRILRKLYGGEDTVRTGCWACTLVVRDRAWERLAAQGLIDRKLYVLIDRWRSLYIHFSRIRPDLWRLRRERREKWRFNYSKLRPEARLALGDCLEQILSHSDYPQDAARPLLEKLGKVLEELEEHRGRLKELLLEDLQALKIYTSCISAKINA